MASVALRGTSKLSTQPHAEHSEEPCHQSNFFPGALVSPEWLVENMNECNIKTLDCSWYVPGSKDTEAKNDFLQHRLPGAQFFDIDDVADRESNLPHMLPSESLFSAKMAELHLGKDDKIVLYDHSGLFSAPRVYFTLRVFGFKNVAILEGGLKRWHHLGLYLDSGAPTNPAPKQPEAYTKNIDKIVDMETMLKNVGLKEAGVPVLDARSAKRFKGEAPEPRPGLRSGHIPYSLSVPFEDVLRIDHESGATLLKTEDELKEVFEGAGLDTKRINHKVFCTCGSGVTAAVLGFALERIGFNNVSVYDGAWAEWGGVDSNPIH